MQANPPRGSDFGPVTIAPRDYCLWVMLGVLGALQLANLIWIGCNVLEGMECCAHFTRSPSGLQ